MFMLKSTHRRLMAEQVIADSERIHDLIEQHARNMISFRQEIVEQAAHENASLKREIVLLKEDIAALNGKLVHVRDNPEPAAIATSGLKEQP